ncbi:hypothetical protein, partial [Burkholderia sp. BCC0801]|uniref:hypothetical protein n=1 Tax=Burkholderia sp. BCC0801 TaxID=2676291 RepID=UPI001ABB273F
ALERLQYLAICESRLLHLQNSLLTRKFYFSQRWISGGITDPIAIQPPYYPRWSVEKTSTDQELRMRVVQHWPLMDAQRLV